jgi:hypothetical protein
MSRHMHCCMDIRGALMHPNDLLGSVTDNKGRKLNKREIQNWLMDELAKGRKVLPLGKACEGFDYQTGCPGHDGPYPPSNTSNPEQQ